MFQSCDLMLSFIRNKNASQSVIDVFNCLHDILGNELFWTLFPALLYDNGSEFSNPTAIEFDNEGNRRDKVFYCKSRASL
jgi:IS30 family transposase